MNPLKSYEKKVFFLIVFAIVIFICIRLFQRELHITYNTPNFLSIHTLLELFSIAVSATLALQAWLLFPHNLSKHRLVIGAVFLSVGLLDLFHTLSYNGMPFFFTESSTEKATWFWIFARGTETLAILYIMIQKDQEVSFVQKRWYFIISFVYTVFLTVGVIIWMDWLPVLVIEGQGVTKLKFTGEMLFCTGHSIAIYLAFKNYRQQKKEALLTLMTAFVFLLIAEIEFTQYKSVYDLDNLLGHIFKIAGYYYLLKGIYLATLDEPFKKKREAEEALRISENNLKSITSTLGEGVFVLDQDMRVTFLNPAGERLLGWTQDELLGKKMHLMVHYQRPDGTYYPEDECPVNETIKYAKTYRTEEDLFIRKGGESFPVAYVTTPIIRNGEVKGSVTVFRDISDLKRTEQVIHQLSYHDALTGLPNRLLFNNSLKIALDYACRNQQVLAVLFLDLDRFKNVNDSLGHSFGDLLLQDVANRLKNVLGERGIVSRLGGDEVTILLSDISHPQDAGRIASKISEELVKPYHIAGAEIYISASMGISLYPFDGDNPVLLLRNADIAMYRAKEQGRNSYQYFTPDMKTSAMEQIELENHLRRALERKEFVVYYQPQIDIPSGNVVGMEALIRWNRKGKEIIPPNIFIPLAEETGLILSIGEWVLHQACMQNKEWQDAGFEPLRVSVNLSAQQFLQRDLVKTVKKILEETGLEARYLELEITESVAMKNETHVIDTLHRLKSLGIEISFDDFGTGYSSLNYLKKYPIHTLKIDRSFIKDIPANHEDAAIATSIIAIAKSLNMEVIAEGVETENQKDFLLNSGCNIMQGFLFGKPMEAREITRLLTEKAG